MIITCNECNSSFKIDDSLIKATGSKVRCSKCNSVFLAYPQPPEAEEQPETALAVSEVDADEQRLDLEEDLESAASELSVADFLSDEEFSEANGQLADAAGESESDALFGAGEEEETVETNAETDLGDLDLDDFEDLVGMDDELETGDASENNVEDSVLALKAEAEALQKTEETDLEKADSEELDLEDIGLEEEDVSAGQKDSVPDSEDLELDLSLDLEPDTIAVGAADDSGAATETFDELDLSDLEAIIDHDEAEPAQDSAAIDSEDLELDLDFQLDDGTETVEAGTAADGPDELDFSDLEKMLESGQAPDVQAPADAAAEDLDLQFDAVEQPTGPVDTAPSDAVAEDDDFLDIEKMLEQGEETAIPEEPQTAVEELDLPLEMEDVLDETSSAADGDLELDFALDREPQEKEELGDSANIADKRLESKLLKPDDADVIDEEALEEAEFQEKDREARATTDDFATDEFTDIRDMYGQTDVLTAAEDVPPPIPFKKTRSSKPLVVALLLIILAAAIIVIPNSLGIKIPYISDLKIPYLSDVKIPYLSDLMKAEAQDVAGNLKLIPLSPSIDGKFIDNSTVGQLFVISGKIKNEYDHPRSFVKVTGKLYQKGQKLIKSSTVFCGNMISDAELAQMDITAINARLQNSFGDKRSNVKIKTGNEIAFMIVFDKLPENLDEYTVEVAGSSI